MSGPSAPSRGWAPGTARHCVKHWRLLTQPVWYWSGSVASTLTYRWETGRSRMMWSGCFLKHPARHVRISSTLGVPLTVASIRLNGVPLLTLVRLDWPETEHLNAWARRHGRHEEITREQFYNGDFLGSLERLLSRPVPATVPEPTGIREAVDVISALLPVVA